MVPVSEIFALGIYPEWDFQTISSFGSHRTIRGFSFLSCDGSPSSGLNYNLSMFKDIEGRRFWNGEYLYDNKIESPYFQNQPTEYYKFVKRVVGELEERGVEVFRLRLSRLPPKSEIAWHSDGTSECDYFIKLHIPLRTNRNCHFLFEKQKFHLDAGRAYLVDVAKRHSFVNASEHERDHIVGDCIVHNKKMPFWCDRIDMVKKFYSHWHDVYLGKREHLLFQQSDFM